MIYVWTSDSNLIHLLSFAIVLKLCYLCVPDRVPNSFQVEGMSNQLVITTCFRRQFGGATLMVQRLGLHHVSIKYQLNPFEWYFLH